MNVTINIDDDTLSDLIKKGIAGLSNETIGGIAREAVEKAFSDPEVAKGLIFTKDNDRYGCSYYDMKLRHEVVDMLMKSITDEDLAKYRKMMLDTLDKEGKHLVTNALSMMLAKKLVDDPMGMLDAVHQKLYEIMENR